MSERVLETDFPLMVPPNPPHVGGVRTVTTPAATASNTSSLSRPQQANPPPPAYNSGSRSSHAPSNAIPGYSYGRHSQYGGGGGVPGTGSDWQYKGSSMTRTVTASANFLPQPVHAAALLGPANPAIGRSGSLKKAYSDGRSRRKAKTVQSARKQNLAQFFSFFFGLFWGTRLSLLADSAFLDALSAAGATRSTTRRRRSRCTRRRGRGRARSRPPPTTTATASTPPRRSRTPCARTGRRAAAGRRVMGAP